MSTTVKIILGLIVIALVVWGVMIYSAHTQTALAPAMNSATTATQVANTSGGTGTAATPAASSPSDTSDAALTQDMTAMTAQMNVVSTNSAAVDQSMNDQPVTQGQ